MIIAFAIIALIIISGLSVGIYAIFIPFMQNVSNIQTYNSAYYGAIMATERALLVTKQQEFWFSGSWWRKWPIQRWPPSDYSNPAMGIVAQENNGIQREIIGKTTRIPQEGKWNIPQIFSANDSNNFNSFSPQDTIIIWTQINDNKDAQTFYDNTISDITHPEREHMQTQRRLPPHIQSRQEPSTAELDDGLEDDIILMRRWQWIHDAQEFVILPTTDTARTWGKTYITADDMHIRESVLNQGLIPTVNFANNFNPIANPPTWIEHTTTWPWGTGVKYIAFEELFNTPNLNLEELYLQYKVMQKPISKAWFIYPFLEYSISSDAEFSDTHRHIQAQSNVGNHEVKIQITKPQSEEIKWSNFTIVF
jgi:hypothetical protein